MWTAEHTDHSPLPAEQIWRTFADVHAGRLTLPGGDVFEPDGELAVGVGLGQGRADDVGMIGHSDSLAGSRRQISPAKTPPRRATQGRSGVPSWPSDARSRQTCFSSGRVEGRRRSRSDWNTT